MLKQLAAVYYTGVKAGGSIKEEANRKGDKVGGAIQGFLVFYIVAMFRLFLAAVHSRSSRREFGAG